MFDESTLTAPAADGKILATRLEGDDDRLGGTEDSVIALIAEKSESGTRRLDLATHPTRCFLRCRQQSDAS
jgi:hypothetical protein